MLSTALTAEVAPCNRSTRSPSCSKGLGLCQETLLTIWVRDAACLLSASTAVWRGRAEPLLGFLCNVGQETGLSTIISQHCLAPFPGCLLGPFCYAVKALCACDHSDKTYHDDNAAKGSRLCKNKQTGLLRSRQSAPESKLPRDKTGYSRERVPGVLCIATDSYGQWDKWYIYIYIYSRSQVTVCFAPHLPLFCKCKTGPEVLHVYMEKGSKGLFQKTFSSLVEGPWLYLVYKITERSDF